MDDGNDDSSVKDDDSSEMTTLQCPPAPGTGAGRRLPTTKDGDKEGAEASSRLADDIMASMCGGTAGSEAVEFPDCFAMPDLMVLENAGGCTDLTSDPDDLGMWDTVF